MHHPVRHRFAHYCLGPLLCVLLGSATFHCASDPIDPDGCKDIEYARCEAAEFCPKFGESFDVDACKRFYRDQCLRGMAASEDPGKLQVKACTKAMQRAGECAKSGATKCDIGGRVIDAPCDIVVAPETSDECGFLGDPEDKQNDKKDASVSPFPDASDD